MLKEKKKKKCIQYFSGIQDPISTFVQLWYSYTNITFLIYK